MAGKLGKYQFGPSFKGWATPITKRNHISAIYGIGPQKVTNVMVQLLSRKYRKLNTTLSSLPTKELDSSDDYTWDVVGTTERNIPLVEARDLSGNVITSATQGMVGVNMEPFYLVFSEAWFFDGEVLFGELNEAYPMRILGDPRYEGTNAVYQVELLGVSTGVPVEQILPGKLFSYAYAPVERGLSRKVGGVRFSAPTSMRNEFSQIRKFHKVSGDMWEDKLTFGLPNPEDSKSTVTMWMHEVELKFEKEWTQEKDNLLMFGTSTRNANGEYRNFGKSGEVLRQGDGLVRQMEYGNTTYYNTFSIKLLTDALYQLSTSKLEFGDRKFIIKTGEMGAIQFNKAALKDASGWSQFQLNGDNLGIWSKASATNMPHGGAYKFAEPMITEWIAPNGVYVKLEVDPMYDDPIQNKIMHPNGGVAYSYRYDIFDIGSSEQPNIFKVAVKGMPEFRGYTAGMRNPFTGAANNDYMSYDEDSAGMHRMWMGGICVLDPLRTMSLIPAILQG